MLQNALQRIKDVDYLGLAKQAWEFGKESFRRAGKFEAEKTTDLGELWGTPVAARPSTILVAAIAAMMYGIAVVPIAFLSLMLHEYAHIFRGRAHGIKTQRVLLTGAGGYAEMLVNRDDDIFISRPRVEWEIGLVGPLASFSLAAIGFFGASVLMILGIPSDTMLLFGQVNLVLGLFNMFPMLPMDGGRVLRGLVLERAQSWHAKAETLKAAEDFSNVIRGAAIGMMLPLPIMGIFLLSQYGGHKEDLKRARMFCEWKAGKEVPPISTAALQGNSWWRVLGFASHPSSLKEVKAAYRKMALVHHPDKGGRPGNMERLVESYNIGKARFG